MSSPAANDLNRILLGSAIGAGIGLLLLALGVAILWTAADQRLTEPAPPLPEASEAPAPTAEAMTYPALPPAPPVPAPLPVEPPQAARPSLWGSIFDTDEEAAAAPRVDPPAPAARPATRPATPRRAPEPQRQEDSLFF